MRNYIIFYAAIIVFVIGGIKWTSYVIEKEKQEELNKINFHKNVTALLQHGGALPAETLNKNIVIYPLNMSDSAASVYKKLNEINSKYAGNTVFYLHSRFGDKEYSDNYFRKIKIHPEPKIIYQTPELGNYLQSLSHYFYNKESLDSIRSRTNTAIVINNTGKITLYKIGAEKDLIDQVEAAIQ